MTWRPRSPRSPGCSASSAGRAVSPSMPPSERTWCGRQVRRCSNADGRSSSCARSRSIWRRSSSAWCATGTRRRDDPGHSQKGARALLRLAALLRARERLPGPRRVLLLHQPGLLRAHGRHEPAARLLSYQLLDLQRLLLVLIPLFTMRLFAEERKLGTLELLWTYPVRDAEIILGKFLACLLVVTVMVAATAVQPIMVAAFYPVAAGPLVAGYLGLWFLV